MLAPELENVKSFTRTNINKPDFTPRKAYNSRHFWHDTDKDEINHDDDDNNSKVGDLYDCRPAINRAFHHCKDVANKGKNKVGGIFVFFSWGKKRVKWNWRECSRNHFFVSSVFYHGLIEIRSNARPLFQIFQILHILKWNWKWKWKDPTCAIFLKSM